MELDRKLWYVRWFFWSAGILDEFFEKDDKRWLGVNGTNLCHFVRTILVSAPLVLALHAVIYGAAIAAVTAVPIYLFGFLGYFSVVLAIAVLVFVIMASVSLYKRSKKAKEAQPAVEKVKPVKVDPSLFQVLGMWVVAKKQKICPTINFSKSQEAR